MIRYLVFLVSLVLSAQFVPFPRSNVATTGASPVSGMSLWFSADCINAGACASQPSNGTTITAWKDRSSGARDAARVTGTTTFHTSQINGQPALTVSSSGFSFTAPSSNDQHTFFIVFRTDNTPQGFPMGGAGGAYAPWVFTTGVSNGFQGLDCRGITRVGQGTTNPGNTNWHQANILHSGSGSVPGTVWQLRMDRAVDPLGASPFPGGNCDEPTTLFYDGSTGFFAGQIAEIIYYNTNLTGPQITTNETYLFNKYGL